MNLLLFYCITFGYFKYCRTQYAVIVELEKMGTFPSVIRVLTPIV
ncbi:hypothetical protein [Chryseobacterium gwangjuense]|nr:hypothetical protein [Chryseobacterium gwangjuense]